MALVSEFLGQLTLNFGGESEPKFPTVVAAVDFDPAKDAARIETAVKTKGVDEQTIIDILTRRSYSQRREIAFEYEKRSKKEDDAFFIEHLMLKWMCSEVKCGYQENPTSFRHILQWDERSSLCILQWDGRSSLCILQWDGLSSLKGTDVATWITIMSERSVPHLQKVFDRYKSYSPYDMQESIRKEVKGDLEKSFLTLGNILQHIINLYSIIYTSISITYTYIL
uniref:Annexin A2b n=1 Tax=Hucho hucho TaxID=62062 RepID=A0A4W5JNZ7_9TELE